MKGNEIHLLTDRSYKIRYGYLWTYEKTKVLWCAIYMR